MQQESSSVDANVACIPSDYSRLVARVLNLQVRDLPQLLELTPLTVEQFLQQDTLISTQQQIQILENGMRLSGDEAFGLRLGQWLTPSTHGALGFLASSSPNLLTALRAFEIYLPTRVNFARIELDSSEGSLQCDCHFEIPLPEETFRCLAEIFVSVFFHCAEFIVGQSLDEVKSSCTYPEPAYSEQYTEYLPGQFEFSAPRLRVQIPMQLCQVPNASANHENYMLAMHQCETMLAKLLPDKNSCQYQIQRMMLSQPPGSLSEEDAAAALFVSKRTLARRLRKEGTSFRQIRDEILSQQASDYLRTSQMSVDAIAALLHYHDSANFRRAFKRWFNVSPSAYRQRALAD